MYTYTYIRTLHKETYCRFFFFSSHPFLMVQESNFVHAAAAPSLVQTRIPCSFFPSSPYFCPFPSYCSYVSKEKGSADTEAFSHQKGGVKQKMLIGKSADDGQQQVMICTSSYDLLSPIHPHCERIIFKIKNLTWNGRSFIYPEN